MHTSTRGPRQFWFRHLADDVWKKRFVTDSFLLPFQVRYSVKFIIQTRNPLTFLDLLEHNLFDISAGDKQSKREIYPRTFRRRKEILKIHYEK